MTRRRQKPEEIVTSRECLAIRVGRKSGSADVVDVPAGLFRAIRVGGSRGKGARQMPP